MDVQEGSTVSHYRILRKIGSGGMGVVYEAEDSQLGRRVAVKFLTDEMERDPSVLERFQREARAASALNHPGICTVHSIEEHERRHFIVMELLEGETLAQRIGNHGFDIGELVDLGIQIADALESAHAKGIVHRDLKPVNLMINPHGRLKVLDFGLAKMGITGGAEGRDGAPSQVDTGQLTAAGTVMGTAYYMSPEQARGLLTDARTDLFSLGAVLYQMATAQLPFPGDTQPVVYEAILNRTPRPVTEVSPGMPPELDRILDKALEKDRNLRYQRATELKTDLLRLKRDLDSGHRKVAELTESKGSAERTSEKSIAVLYFENPGGVKEDEYLRDGITEDIITELSKIKGMQVFSRPTVLVYRDKPVTPTAIGQQLGAAFVLAGSLRRAGSRLRITTQLVDARTDFPLWSERYDREMKDVFELQDEIAQKIAAALRIQLSPQEQEALAAKPTDNLQAYDLYLRGRSYARRLTRQDLEFALQMFENAVTQDEGFALAFAAIANVCAYYHAHYSQEDAWIDRARAAAERAMALQPDVPEVMVAQAWILYAKRQYDEMTAIVRNVVARKRDCEGAYYLLLRGLYASGKYQEVANVADEAIESSGTDYNVYVPILNSLGAIGKEEAVQNIRHRAIQAMEGHVRQVPEDARARILMAAFYAEQGRHEDAVREANLAMLLRPNEAMVHYNAACTFCLMNKKAEALEALNKAWRNGFRDAVWARRDPDLTVLHGDPEFDKLYPELPS